ncbi:single-stranded DNA-binding protein [Corynebacterium sphenisci DSM 44792]|uniref:Single-stranded DNA-binding protein n=1 Tax=Corynebacterium sphenisci DSM 44792 TaxID=1437874 RepID=A0A1L7D081_9CORY|nr:single-stranded DNA-binding protein [Corynebacterium sphenisci]APT91555.1 single-stranded DNA-binding protein [Corynebacterium sphenisci DSM 44792]
MAQGETPITLIGNVVADPELRYTASGTAVTNFRVASTPRVYDKQAGQWTDGEALFLTCNAWREMAENVMETLSKGMRVIVQGRLRQRSYETRDGERRTVYEIEADEVGPSLRFASAQVTRNPRGGGSGGGGSFGGGGGQSFGGPRGGSGGGQPSGSFGGGQPAEDPWNSAPPAGDFGGGDEPPF